VIVTECAVVKVLFSGDEEPYAIVVPKNTCEVDGWSVVQLMVAVVVVDPETTTPEITGATAVVTKVELADVLDAVEPFTEVTSKSYVVPAVRPVSTTEWVIVDAAPVALEP
jgi:hypothetical protein